MSDQPRKVPEDDTGAPPDERRHPLDGPRPWHRNPWVLAIIAGAITIPALRPCLRHIPEPPEVIGELPAFELQSQLGEPFGSEDLAGDVYIANTFFTSCQTVCPPLMEAMSGLQDRIEREAELRDGDLDIHLVSITVDPGNDTPERLREYGERYSTDPDHWTLLTGDEQAVRELVVEGFMTAMGPEETDPDNPHLIHIAHTSRLMLVDGFGRIRGYYETTEAGIDEAFHRATHVLRVREDEAEELRASR